MGQVKDSLRTSDDGDAVLSWWQEWKVIFEFDFVLFLFNWQFTTMLCAHCPARIRNQSSIGTDHLVVSFHISMYGDKAGMEVNLWYARRRKSWDSLACRIRLFVEFWAVLHRRKWRDSWDFWFAATKPVCRRNKGDSSWRPRFAAGTPPRRMKYPGNLEGEIIFMIRSKVNCNNASRPGRGGNRLCRRIGVVAEWQFEQWTTFPDMLHATKYDQKRIDDTTSLTRRQYGDRNLQELRS